MHHAGSSTFPAPSAPDLLAPVRRFVHQAMRRVRQTRQGRVWLGEGQSLLVMPAFHAGPESTAAMRRFLLDCGFSTHDWGLGTDQGAGRWGLGACLRALEEQVIEAFEADRQPVTVLGWGLSGIYAREVAKRVTPLVRQVVTLGTPVRASPQAMRECAMLRALESPGLALPREVWQRLRQRPPVPCTSIYTQRDDQVPWRLSLDGASPWSENVAVPAPGHRQLALHSRTLEVITHRLVQPDGEWHPYAG